MPLIVLSILQSHAALPKKENKPNLFVFMHGAYILELSYTDCDGKPQKEQILARNKITRCVQENSLNPPIKAGIAGVKNSAIPFYLNGKDKEGFIIKMGPTGITMDCGGIFDPIFNVNTTKCDYSVPYKPY